MARPTPPPEPDVIRVLRDYRQALEARDIAIMETMGREWLLVEQRLDADMAALAYRMDELRREGKPITEQMVWREQRYKYLHAQMEKEIKAYNVKAVAIIEQAQLANAELGINAANEAIQLSYNSVSAVGPYWNRLNLGAVQSMVGFAGDGSPLRKLLAADYPDAVDGMMRALINGIARGTGPGAVAREMANGLGMGLDRAVLIARTESARAYRTASTQQYRESGVVTGFYRLVKKETACMGCLALDGERFDVASELHDHPAGKCVAVPGVIGVGRPKWENGLTWFRQLAPEQQIDRMGPGRYQLWKDGQIKLTDLARVNHSEVWGDSPRVATISELTETGE